MGIILGITGESLRFWAIGYSRGHTRGLVVDAPFLATGGPYALCRHPLYLGNALNSLGVLLAAVGDCGEERRHALCVLTLISVLVIYGGIIPLEERYLDSVHGESYARYREAVPSFFPTKGVCGPCQGSFCLDSALYFERWTLFWWGLIWAYLSWRI